MSLTDFVERPAIREAFRGNTRKISLPREVAEAPLLVPSCGTRHAFVGTAFDYMARFRIVRDLAQTCPNAVTVIDMGWVAEGAVLMIRDHPIYRRWHPRWENMVSRARELFLAYVDGREGDHLRIARCAQCLAAADALSREGRFRQDFMPEDDLNAELIALMDVFKPGDLFNPLKLVALNPGFKASGRVGGADADLVVDGAVIDFKTTKTGSAADKHMRQVTGYAILRTIGGLELGADDDLADIPDPSVGIYFSRHGMMANWSLDEIFLPGGFARFRDAFLDDLRRYPPGLAA
jgi:hypothetical protein